MLQRAGRYGEVGVLCDSGRFLGCPAVPPKEGGALRDFQKKEQNGCEGDYCFSEFRHFSTSKSINKTVI